MTISLEDVLDKRASEFKARVVRKNEPANFVTYLETILFLQE